MLGKRLINSNSAAAGGSCTTDTLQILGDTSCIAYYKMSDATDESGNYDGTATNVNFNVAGKFGNAAEFNGSSGIIDIPTIPNITGSGSNFSFSAWINFDGSSGDRFIMSFRENSFVEIGFNSGYSPRKLEFKVNDGANKTVLVNESEITNNTWHHICLTAESSGNLTAYLDGTSKGTTAIGSIGNAGQQNSIGAYNTGTPAGYFTGKIDQVRIFNKALTGTEVTTLNDEVYCVPTIVPTDNFTPITYTGNGGTQSTNSLSNQSGTINFKPDFSWIKVRSTTNDHTLQNSISGTSKFLRSNTTDAEGSNIEMVTSYNSNGFSLGPNALANQSSETYVAWNWKAGGADVLNEEGTVDSQVSANVDAGFSIITYTGTGTNNSSVGHGLDSKPEMFIYKRTSSTGAWSIVHKDVNNYKAYLSFTTAAATNDTNMNAPTDEVIRFNTTAPTYNGTNQDWLIYAFHSVDGFSKIGSYTGTGATGNSIVTGFRPAYVMVKGATLVSQWNILDNKRDTTNPATHRLFANLSNAEATGVNALSFLSNGFQIETNDAGFNGSNQTYIFMAFAEEVFNPNGVTRNATNPFGDGSETNLYKFEDNATDSEGNNNGNDGGTVTYATGYIDKAAVFNGSSSQIVVSTISNVKSYSFWINAGAIGSNYGKRLFGLDSSGYTDCVTYIGNSSSSVGVVDGSGNVYYSDTVSDNNWHHIVVTTNGTDTLKIYTDGNLSSTNSTSYFTSSFTHIGSDNANRRFGGKLDQVRIFDRALDSGEVTQLYNE